jgi:hypothetical protein
VLRREKTHPHPVWSPSGGQTGEAWKKLPKGGDLSLLPCAPTGPTEDRVVSFLWVQFFYCPLQWGQFFFFAGGGIASRLVGGRNAPIVSSFPISSLFVRLALSCRPSTVRVPIGHRLQGKTNKASQEERDAKTVSYQTTNPSIPCVGWRQGV